MYGRRVLVIDDDPGSTELVARAFSGAGAEVHTARHRGEGLRKLFDCRPDLVVLDITMPAMSGWETLRRIRDLGDIPVIVLSRLGEERDVLRGLNLGASDYLTKPFSIELLLARARAALRRPSPQRAPKGLEVYDDGYLHLDLDGRCVCVRGQHVHLSDTEFRLLSYLSRNAGRLLSYDQVLQAVWGWRGPQDARSVHVYLCRLRKKLEQDSRNPKYLLTSRGLGCRFEKQERPRQTREPIQAEGSD